MNTEAVIAIERAYNDGQRDVKAYIEKHMLDKIKGIRHYLEVNNIDCAMANLSAIERQLRSLGFTGV